MQLKERCKACLQNSRLMITGKMSLEHRAMYSHMQVSNSLHTNTLEALPQSLPKALPPTPSYTPATEMLDTSVCELYDNQTIT